MLYGQRDWLQFALDRNNPKRRLLVTRWCISLQKLMSFADALVRGVRSPADLDFRLDPHQLQELHLRSYCLLHQNHNEEEYLSPHSLRGMWRRHRGFLQPWKLAFTIYAFLRARPTRRFSLVVAVARFRVLFAAQWQLSLSIYTSLEGPPGKQINTFSSVCSTFDSLIRTTLETLSLLWNNWIPPSACPRYHQHNQPHRQPL